MHEIKCCPFCGSRPTLFDEDGVRATILCTWCGTERQSEDGVEGVIKDWNRRFSGDGVEYKDE